MSSSSTITATVLDSAAGNRGVCTGGVNTRSSCAAVSDSAPSAVSTICSGRCGDCEESRDGARANSCRLACVKELDAFGSVADVAAAGVKAADLAAARADGYGSTGPIVAACFGAASMGVDASSARRLRLRDLCSLGLECAAITAVEEKAVGALIQESDCDCRRGVEWRGSAGGEKVLTAEGSEVGAAVESLVDSVRTF